MVDLVLGYNASLQPTPSPVETETKLREFSDVHCRAWHQLTRSNVPIEESFYEELSMILRNHVSAEELQKIYSRVPEVLRNKLIEPENRDLMKKAELVTKEEETILRQLESLHL